MIGIDRQRLAEIFGLIFSQDIIVDFSEAVIQFNVPDIRLDKRRAHVFGFSAQFVIIFFVPLENIREDDFRLLQQFPRIIVFRDIPGQCQRALVQLRHDMERPAEEIRRAQTDPRELRIEGGKDDGERQDRGGDAEDDAQDRIDRRQMPDAHPFAPGAVEDKCSQGILNRLKRRQKSRGARDRDIRPIILIGKRQKVQDQRHKNNDDKIPQRMSAEKNAFGSRGQEEKKYPGQDPRQRYDGEKIILHVCEPSGLA